MKKSILILLAIVISTGAFAQFGIKVGASSNNFKLDEVTSGSSVIAAAGEANWGFHGGVFYRFSLLGIIIQPEVLFATSENTLKIDDGTTADQIVSQKYNKLDIPVMLGLKLGPIRIMAGPAATIMLSSDTDLSDVEGLYKSATFGYQAGLGFDLGKITVDARYESGLSNFGTEATIGGETLVLDGRSNAIVLSLGFMF
ncbi:MAG: PorT family protein [Bacteroidia bacterium]|nr:MAG: PorT family protein [Bacteroidia bacterium]